MNSYEGSSPGSNALSIFDFLLSFLHFLKWCEALSSAFGFLVGQRQKIDPSTLIHDTYQDLMESTLNPDLNRKSETKYFQIYLRASYFCNQIEN